MEPSDLPGQSQQAGAPQSDERLAETLQAVEALRQEVAAVKQTVADLRTRLAATEAELSALKQSLGV